MQRGKLDRDAGIFADIVRFGLTRQGRYRVLIGGQKPLSVFGRQRGFPQHIVGVGIAARFSLFTALHSLGDGLTKDELCPHFLHGPSDGCADHRLAQPFDGPFQTRDNTMPFLQDFSGQHQSPR